MKSKKEIVQNWLPRYTGTPLDEFGEHILLTNFGNYVDMFAKWHDVPVKGADHQLRENLAAVELKLPADALAALERLAA